jgi:S-disulfanyl-L-cysteine oxidoreductase SoxD
MFKLVNQHMKSLFVFTFLFAVIFGVFAQEYASSFQGISRFATPAEVKAWDIDVRPDFKGLPKGSGSVEKGQEIWEGRCASCHGTFGESNSVFTPIVGGVTSKDIEIGRVASLTDPKQPQRTTFMKVATISSLYDYIYRAMPWNAPRSMSADDTFAVLAYLLNLVEIVPDDFTLSDQNIAEIQKKMPNRNGMTQDHGLWRLNDKPDVHAKACMNNCAQEVKVTSFLPDYARNAHGNLQDQNRIFGPYRGVDTTNGSPKSIPTSIASSVVAEKNQDPSVLFRSNTCAACHAQNTKIVGPSLESIKSKYATQANAIDTLSAKVKNGGSGVWGQIPMPANNLPDADIKKIVTWILTGH